MSWATGDGGVVLDGEGRARLSAGPTLARVLLAGDLCPIRRGGRMLAEGRAAAALGRCLDLFAAADVTIVNLESPLCRGGAPIAKCGPNFRAEPEVAAALADAGVAVACLANNHVMDHGAAGLRETMAALDAAGVRHCGAGESADLAARPLLIDTPAGTLGIVNVAEGEFAAAPSDGGPGAAPLDPLANARAVAAVARDARWILAVVHHGNEQVLFPSPQMRRRCAELIEAGASAVVGHHPHVIQGIELCGRRPVVHSLGNFLFDWAEPEPECNTGLVIELALGEGGVTGLAAHPVGQTADGGVDLLDGPTRSRAVELLNELSAPLGDAGRMARLWDQQCVELARTRYAQQVRFPGGLATVDPKRPLRAELLALNMLDCPAHREALTRIMQLRVAGRLRDDPELRAGLADLMDRLKAMGAVA